MGLLDSADAQFALGLLAAASPKAQRTSLGEGLLSAYQGKRAWEQQNEDRAQKKAAQELQMQLANAQIEETKAQAAQRQAQAEEAKRKAQEAEALRQRQQQFLMGGMVGGPMAGVGGPSIMAGSGQRTPEENAQVASQAQARGFDFATAVSLFGPEHATKLMQGMNDARNFGRNKVARTIEGQDANGRPVTLQKDDYGDTIGSPIKQWKAPVEVRRGDRVDFIDPTDMSAKGSFGINLSPDALLSAETTRRGQNMTDARARDANRIAESGNVIKAETDLRKEFADLPEVKNYKTALPAFVAIRDASTRNNPQADINLIYGLAKLYDPTSVVREGEYATIANSQSIPEWLKGHAQRLEGGGRLTPATKAQIMQEATGRIGAFEAEYQGAQQTFEGIAKQRGVNPSNVFTPVGESRRKLDAKTVTRTGRDASGRKVVQYSDGSIAYAD